MFQFDIRRLDIYRKVPKDLTQPTRSGALVSIATVAFCLYLLLAEYIMFMQPEMSSEVYVDDPVKYSEYIPVYLNITLHNLPCERVGLDTQDDMGRFEVGMVTNVFKKELAENTGCQLESSFRIAKVPGNFHVSTHAADARSADAGGPASGNHRPVNLAHTIHQLSFGNSPGPELSATFGEASSFTPLNDRSLQASEDSETHEYFLKIVPSIYDGPLYRRYPFQFTAMYRKVSASEAPQNEVAIWFRYDLAPIVVKYREVSKPFYHFLTQVCAIIGGAFTVAGIVDSLLFSASQVLLKSRIGKLP